MDVLSKIETVFSFSDPAWRPFPRKAHNELNLASNELWHNTDTNVGALVCPLAEHYPEFICSKSGLDHLHNAKQDGNISEGYVVLSRWNDVGRIIEKIMPIAEVVASLKGITPNQGRGRYGPFYWLQASGKSADDAPF